jgi:hypothetical protein
MSYGTGSDFAIYFYIPATGENAAPELYTGMTVTFGDSLFVEKTPLLPDENFGPTSGTIVFTELATGDASDIAEWSENGNLHLDAVSPSCGVQCVTEDPIRGGFGGARLLLERRIPGQPIRWQKLGVGFASDGEEVFGELLRVFGSRGVDVSDYIKLSPEPIPPPTPASRSNK